MKAMPSGIVQRSSSVFRCQICGQVAPAGARARRVVLVSREKTYAQRGGFDGFQRRFRGPRPPKQEFDKGGKGHEIVREVLACNGCAERVTPVVEAAPVEEVEIIRDETVTTPEVETPEVDAPEAVAVEASTEE